MGINQPTPWTAERDAFLTAMHGQKDEPSFSVMAAAINDKFGTALTRNSLIGRASRIKLAKRLHKVNSRFKKQLVRKPRLPPKPRQRFSNGSKRMMTIFESVEAIEIHCAEIEPLNLTLLELNEQTECHWPYGETPDIRFCGHPKMDGSSYCWLHFALSKRRMT